MSRCIFYDSCMSMIFDLWDICSTMLVSKNLLRYYPSESIISASQTINLNLFENDVNICVPTENIP